MHPQRSTPSQANDGLGLSLPAEGPTSRHCSMMSWNEAALEMVYCTQAAENIKCKCKWCKGNANRHHCIGYTAMALPDRQTFPKLAVPLQYE